MEQYYTLYMVAQKIGTTIFVRLNLNLKCMVLLQIFSWFW